MGPVEGRLIRDSSITASSKQTPSAKISEVRIGGNDGWSPHASDKLPYLQFDLEKLYLICGFEVLGCKGSYVNLYRVHVSPEKDYLDSWNIIKVMTSECLSLASEMKTYTALLIKYNIRRGEQCIKHSNFVSHSYGICIGNCMPCSGIWQ